MSRLLFALSLATLTTGALAQTWDETADGGADAGGLIGSAQTVYGNGPLTTITGFMDGGGEEDGYIIEITDPASFSATTINALTEASSVTDTQLWLFDESGAGVQFIDDDPNSGTFLSNMLNDFVVSPGCYMLVVSGFTNDAENSDGDEIWLDTPFNVLRQPDGAGAGNPVVTQWDMNSGQGGEYQIDLTGCSFKQQAECWLLLGTGQGDIPLDFLGVPGQADRLLIDPNTIFGRFDVTLDDIPVFDIPNDPGMIGVHIFAQILMLNPIHFPDDALKMSNAVDVPIHQNASVFGPSSGMQIWVNSNAYLGGVLDIGFLIEGS